MGNIILLAAQDETSIFIQDTVVGTRSFRKYHETMLSLEESKEIAEELFFDSLSAFINAAEILQNNP
jgi:hypothetical protein